MTRRSGELRQARPLLGTIVELVVDGLGEKAARAAMADAFATVAEVQRRMSYHDPASALSRINREAARGAAAVDEWTFAVLSAAAEMHRVSRGVFDVTVAPQLEALGFLPGRDGTPCRPPGERSEAAGAADATHIPPAASLRSPRTARSAVPTCSSLMALCEKPVPRDRFSVP